MGPGHRNLLLVLLGSVLLGAVTLAWFLTSDSSSAAACNAKSSPEDQLACLIAAAESADDGELCDRAATPEIASACYWSYAAGNVPADACDSLDGSDPELRAICLSGIAYAKRDPKFCRDMSEPGQRDTCFLILVTQFNVDPAYCGQIAEPALKRSCALPQ